MLAKIQELKPKYDVSLTIGGVDYHIITFRFTKMLDNKIVRDLKALRTYPQFQSQTQNYLEKLTKIDAEEIVNLYVKLIYSPPINIAEIIAVYFEKEHQLTVFREINHYDFSEKVDKFTLESIQKYCQQRIEFKNSASNRLLKEISWIKGNILRIGKFAYDLSGSEITFDYKADESDLAYKGKIDWNHLDENGCIKHGFVIVLASKNKSIWDSEINGIMKADFAYGSPHSWCYYWFGQKAQALRKFFDYPEPM